jgi:hypothetical protein
MESLRHRYPARRHDGDARRIEERAGDEPGDIAGLHAGDGYQQVDGQRSGAFATRDAEQRDKHECGADRREENEHAPAQCQQCTDQEAEQCDDSQCNDSHGVASIPRRPRAFHFTFEGKFCFDLFEQSLCFK